MNDVTTFVFATLARAAGVDVSAVQATSTIQQLNIASLDAIEILFDLEEKYDLEFGDRDVDLGTATAADLVAAVEQALARKSAVVDTATTAGAV
jgi:acyl carrier protein